MQQEPAHITSLGRTVPVGPRMLPTAADLAHIAEEYGLALSAERTRPLGGAVNGVVAASTGRGEVLVRVHRPWTTPERLEFVHDVMAQLRALGLPVPRVISRPGGRSWTRVRDRLVEVVEYVPHDRTVGSWGEVGDAFGLLGRLHSSLALLDVEVVPAPVSSYADPVEAIRMLDETETEFRSRPGHPDYDRALSARNRAREVLGRLAEHWHGVGRRLPRGLVHGDYGPGNLLVRGSRIAAVVDFDFADERERAFDVAYGLYFALDRLGDFDRTALAREPLWRYAEAVAPSVTEAELESLPYEMARVPLYWIAEAGYLPDPVGQTLEWEPHVGRAGWLVSNTDLVRRALVD